MPTEILLYGEVGYDFSAEWLNSVLDGSEGDVTLRVHSPGGDVFDGVAISNTIRRARGAGRHIEAVVDGLAASAASYMCLTCDRVLAGPGAVWMVHQPSGGCYGTASDMRETAQALDVCHDSIIDLYHIRNGRPDEEIERTMAASTWMRAKDAIAFGLADGMDESDAPDLSAVDAKWAGARDSAALAAFAEAHPALSDSLQSLRTHSGLFAERLERSREVGNPPSDNARPTVVSTGREGDGDAGAAEPTAVGATAHAVANGHVYRIGDRKE